VAAPVAMSPPISNSTRRLRLAVDRQLARRYLRKTGIGPATKAFADRYGLVVRGGPFQGLRYVPSYVRWSGDLIPKLLGTYEEELHPVIERWLEGDFDTIVDVGSAEGYYAVGLARGIPGARVFAFDVHEHVNRICAEIAAANGVRDRLHLGRDCDCDALQALAGRRTAVLLDCEGCERHLLMPAEVPGLALCELLVELHDDIDPGLSDTVVRRLRETHDVHLIERAARKAADHPELENLEPTLRDQILGELRLEGVRWGHFVPRG
jgi:hypothetical protein